VIDTVIAMTFDDGLTWMSAASTIAERPGTAPKPACVEDAFADLVYADDDWVRAEFDAIIEESFAEPPRRPRRWQGWRSPRPSARRCLPCPGKAKLAAGRGDCRHSRRQRSPPR
jgi:hypothetical protein